MSWIRKPFRYAILFSCILALGSAFVMLDTFVIPRTGQAVALASSANTQTQIADAPAQTDTVVLITDNSYMDGNLHITIETMYVDNTAVYIADIQVSDAASLKTALANNLFGRNIKQTTSDMAENNHAILAINGDYYGFRNDGYVIRNGVLYRDVAGDRQDLVIDADGNFYIIEESEISAQGLLAAGAWQVLSFGPRWSTTEPSLYPITAR